MKYIYVLINFLLLVGILWLVGRRMIAGIFSRRRDAIGQALDEAEAIERECALPPEEPETEAQALPVPEHGEALRRIAEKQQRDTERIAAQTEQDIFELRRENMFQKKAETVSALKDKITELFLREPYASILEAKTNVYVDQILDRIRVTPGDMAYLKVSDVLYVTLTSARPLPEETVERITRRVTLLLDTVGGKPSVWVKTDETLIGGVRLRIGDTVYDCTVVNRLYELDKLLDKRSLFGIRTAETLGSDMLAGIRALDLSVDEYQLGRVISVSDGICWLDGLADTMYGEVVEFECGERGMVLDIEQSRIGCIIYGSYEHIASGSRVRSVGRIASVPVGDALLGRVVDPLGHAIDGGGRIWTAEKRPIECRAPGIPDRSAVSRPLHTGIKAIDALVPIGRGQRELIIGDRQTGKSSIAMDTILNQKGKDTVCIYVAIGQKETTVAEIREKLEKGGAMEYTTIVCAPASSSASLQYIAPFAGAAMAEHFMYNGRDVLIVYDDLSKHAVAYRELSLLLHRPSGREAYPGDVFYLHARLLERSAQLSEELGGGSMTALPIIETQAGDITAYIPTNVISITDGQIFLETDLFNEGQRPAINVGLSVSRVGGSAQTKAMKQVSGSLRTNLAQYRELAGFAQFGSDLDAATRSTLDAGERMMAALRQPRFMPLPDWKQIVLIFAVSEGFASGVAPEDMADFESAVYAHMSIDHPELIRTLESGEKMSAETLCALREALRDVRMQTAAEE